MDSPIPERHFKFTVSEKTLFEIKAESHWSWSGAHEPIRRWPGGYGETGLDGIAARNARFGPGVMDTFVGVAVLVGKAGPAVLKTAPPQGGIWL